MEIKSKICPSCEEENNPTFSKCWACGVDFSSEKTLTQSESGTGVSSSKPKKLLSYRLFLGVSFLLASLGALSRDLTGPNPGASLKMGGEFLSALFGLLIMTLINSLLFYGVYRAAKFMSRAKTVKVK